MNNKDKLEEPKQAELDFTKASLDYAKQFATLSTISIVIVSAFIIKGFPTPIWKPLIGISLIFFILSVIASVVFHTILIGNHPGQKTYTFKNENIKLAINIAWIGFLMGIFLLAIFAIRNVAF